MTVHAAAFDTSIGVVQARLARRAIARADALDADTVRRVADEARRAIARRRAGRLWSAVVVDALFVGSAVGLHETVDTLAARHAAFRATVDAGFAVAVVVAATVRTATTRRAAGSAAFAASRRFAGVTALTVRAARTATQGNRRIFDTTIVARSFLGRETTRSAEDRRANDGDRPTMEPTHELTLSNVRSGFKTRTREIPTEQRAHVSRTKSVIAESQTSRAGSSARDH